MSKCHSSTQDNSENENIKRKTRKKYSENLTNHSINFISCVHGYFLTNK